VADWYKPIHLWYLQFSSSNAEKHAVQAFLSIHSDIDSKYFWEILPDRLFQNMNFEQATNKELVRQDSQSLSIQIDRKGNYIS
jgi:hypothetical protein